MEYPPPEYSFTGLQFNPAFFGNEPTTAGGPVPDPLPINELNTNNIQAKNPASDVFLYTNPITSTLTLGENTLPQLKTRSLFNFAYTDVFSLYNILESVKNIFVMNIAGLFKQDIYADASTGYVSAGIEVSDNAPVTANYDGNMSLKSRRLTTGNSIRSADPTGTLNLYTNQTGTFNLGNSSIVQFFIKGASVLLGNFDLSTAVSFAFNSLTSVGCSFYGDSSNPSTQSANFNVFRSTTTPTVSNTGNCLFECGTMSLQATQLTAPNTIVGNATTAVDLFTNQTAGAITLGTTTNINLGNATGTGRLRTQNTVISGSTTTALSLYGTHTSTMTLGSSTATLTVPNTVQGAGTTGTINLFATHNGDIYLGTTSATLYTPNTVRAFVLGSAVNFCTSQTAQISIGGIGILQLTNNIVSNAIANTLDLFATQTGQINLGGATAGVVRLVNSIIANATGNIVNLFSTNTGDISIGGTGQIINNVSNFIVKGVGANLNISKRIQPSVGGITDTYFCDGARPAVASVILEADSNNSATANDGSLKIYGRNLTQFNPAGTISKRTSCAVGNIDDIYYVDTTRLTTASATITASSNGTATANDGYIQLSARNIIMGNAILPQYSTSYNVSTGTVTAGTIGLVVSATFSGTGVNLAQNTAYVTGQISVPVNGVYIFHLTQGFNPTTGGSTNRHITDMLVRNFTNVNQISLGTESFNGNQQTTNYFMSTSAMYVFTGIAAGQPWNVQSRFETGTFTGVMQLINGNFRFTSTRIA